MNDAFNNNNNVAAGLPINAGGVEACHGLLSGTVRLTQIGALLGFVVFAATTAIPAQAQGNQRPLSDFINAQGTTQCFTPPAPAQLGWGTGIDKTNGNANLTPGRFALIDYTGLEGKFLLSHGINLGTTVSGSVQERSLADGRALVTVDLNTKNALGWAINHDPVGPLTDFNNNPLLFGARVQDLIADSTRVPGLGNAHFRVVFTNTGAGAPLPDLVCTNASQDCPQVAACPAGFEIDSLDIEASITGPLHALAGLGAEGTPGRLDVTQIGPINAAIQNGFKGPLRDAFPVESIALRSTGQ
jgi:hypothetical protein